MADVLTATEEMERAVRCLRLELPDAVYLDVRERWENVKRYIEDLEQ